MDASFLALSLITVGLAFGFALTGRSREGLWFVWLMACFLLPSWKECRLFGSFELDLRTMAALAALIGFLISPDLGPRGWGRWLLSDSLVALLFASMVVSELAAGELGLMTGPMIARRWLLPYLVGRFFVRSWDDVRCVSALFGLICLALPLYGLVEMVTRTNIVNAMLGQSFALLEAGQGYRWGLKRAQGMGSHPIFFGMTLTLLLPWAFEAAHPNDGRPVLPRCGALPVVAVAGIASALSRGPAISAIVTLLSIVYFRAPRLRPVIAAVALAGAAGAVIGHEFVMETLSEMAEEKKEDAVPILIKGKVEMYTGTTHRVLQFKAYEDAIADAGLFGFGQQCKAVQANYPVHPFFWSIDCHYLLHFLQYGYVGLSLFVLLTLEVLFRLGRVAWSDTTPYSALAGGMLGAMATVSVSLLSVFLAYDFGAIWLFYAGLSGNFSNLASDSHPQPGPSELGDLEDGDAFS
jgi:hypothetical protein